MLLRNLTTGIAIAAAVQRPTSPFARMKGLIGRAHLNPGEGLWLDRCCAIHTIGVRVPLDVVFLDRADRVIKVLTGVPPLQPVIFCQGAHTVVELCGGTIMSSDVLRGDVLRLVA
jgi:uncharacterized membrane protein (UPF0127 family)